MKKKKKSLHILINFNYFNFTTLKCKNLCQPIFLYRHFTFPKYNWNLWNIYFTKDHDKSAKFRIQQTVLFTSITFCERCRTDKKVEKTWHFFSKYSNEKLHFCSSMTECLKLSFKGKLKFCFKFIPEIINFWNFVTK